MQYLNQWRLLIHYTQRQNFNGKCIITNQFSLLKSRPNSLSEILLPLRKAKNISITASGQYVRIYNFITIETSHCCCVHTYILWPDPFVGDQCSREIKALTNDKNESVLDESISFASWCIMQSALNVCLNNWEAQVWNGGVCPAE